ncbi:hypothetical protein J4411_01775 [Candidatus Pacearchaeota archaeon]|nr:hypothetical protein [Candidatus Pacearchaeota archaeon]
MKYKEYAPIAARYGISFVFLVFGLWQIIDPKSWLGYLPGFVFGLGLSPVLILTMNGILDFLIGLSLVLGIYIRFFSVVGIFHLLGIELSLGFTDVTIRDISIMIVLFSVFLNGKDKWCLKRTDLRQ